MNLKKSIIHLENEANYRYLTEMELQTRSRGIKRILELEKIVVMNLKQKERVKWMIDGDENTKFFHGYINSNK